MYIPEFIPEDEQFILHLKPVLNKNRIFFKMKQDGRMKRQVYHLKLHVKGGYIEGDFFLDGVTTRLPDQDERFVKL